MRLLKKGSTPVIPFFIGAGKTGLSLSTKRISKDGGTFASISGSIVELENGWYKVSLSASETGTNGILAIYISDGGTTNVFSSDFQVVAFDPADAVTLGLSDITAIKGYVDLIDDGTNGLAAIKTQAANAASDAATIKSEIQHATYGLSVLKAFDTAQLGYSVKARFFKSSTAAIVMVKLFTAAGVAETGKTLGQAALYISKNGGAFAAVNGTTWTERGSGWYAFTLSTTDTNTTGELVMQCQSATGFNWTVSLGFVVSFDPYSATSLGLTNLGTNTTTIYNVVNDVTYGNSALQTIVYNNNKELVSVVHGLPMIKTDTANILAEAQGAKGFTAIHTTATSVESKVDILDTNLDSTIAKVDTIDSKVNAFRFVDMKTYTEAMSYMLNRLVEAVMRLKNGS